MSQRIVGVVLVVAGVALTLAGLWGRLVLVEDEGHHDGREPGFALAAERGADVLVAAPADPDAPASGGGSGVAVHVERAGQVLVDYDEVHDGRFHVWVVERDLGSYLHAVFPEASPNGTYVAGPVGSGDHRVVVQSAPAGGPDLLELGADVRVELADEPVARDATSGTSPAFADGDTWSDGDLTIERQGFDFVLSEPWTGEEHLGGPAFLALFRAEDLAFVHDHATVVGDERFSFAVDLPGRGTYLAALELVQDGELVTALFRLTV